MIIYSRKTCAPCKTIKYLFDKKGIQYEVRDVDESPEYERQWLAYGSRAVPVLVSGERFVAGFNMSAIMDLVDYDRKNMHEMSQAV
jgi:glutaredoxin